MTTYNANGQVEENKGKGNSSNFAAFIGCRVAGPPTYTPAHQKPNTDKTTQASCTFNVFQNIRGKALVFNITAWGGLADVCARSITTGKEVELFCNINAYKGRAWMPTPDGTPAQFVQKPDGTPLLVDKVGFNIDRIRLGEDSAKTVQEEINAGIRPPQWNNPASPDANAWSQECARRNSMQFDQNNQYFGYAKVRMPIQGSRIVPNNVANQAQNNGGGAQGYGTQYQGNPGAVNNGFNNGGNQGGYQAHNNGGNGYQQNNNGYQQNNGGGQPVNVNGNQHGYTAPQGGGQNNGYAPQGGGYQHQGANCAPGAGTNVSM